MAGSVAAGAAGAPVAPREVRGGEEMAGWLGDLKTVGGDICVTATVIELPLAGATGIAALAGLATIYGV